MGDLVSGFVQQLQLRHVTLGFETFLEVSWRFGFGVCTAKTLQTGFRSEGQALRVLGADDA